MRNQKNEYISDKRMPLVKHANCDLLVWEVTFPFLTVEICVTSTGGLRQKSSVPQGRLDDPVSAVGLSTVPSSHPPSLCTVLRSPSKLKEAPGGTFRAAHPH